MLTHPDLTGMSQDTLDELIAALAEAQVAQRERHGFARGGRERQRAAGAGAHQKLSDADRVLATVLYMRKLCTRAVLGELSGVDRKVITTAVQDTRPLLKQHGHTVTPSTARFPTPSDLGAFLADTTKHRPEIKPAC